MSLGVAGVAFVCVFAFVLIFKFTFELATGFTVILAFLFRLLLSALRFTFAMLVFI